jgi:cold shock CspA family protein
VANDRKIGTIIRLLRDKAYGFIKVDGDRDYFFHKAELRDCTLDDLHDGTNDAQPTAVSFTVGQSKSGRVQAMDVRLADE